MLLFAYYLLKVIICSAILFGYYWFFLRNKIFHGYNRFYLLATIVLSLILPLLKFNVWHTNGELKPAMIQMLQVVNSSDEFLDEIIVYSHYRHITSEQAANWVFMMGSLLFALIFVWTLLKIYTLKKNNPAQYFNNISIINTHDKSTPFSFLKNIFWNCEIDINSKNGERILKHELVHVQEKHSHDKLFINIVLIFFWCNPIFWLLRKELNLVHEFLADKKAVEDGDTAAFAAMILQTTYPGHRFELTNNFFYSPIKRRLTMLTKNNQSKVSYISRLLVLPVAVFVFAAFTLKAKTIINTLPKDKTIKVVIDAGHGGTDGGGISPLDGTKEKDLSLDLLKKIKALNQDENIKLLYTRETDISQSPKEKAELVNKLGADLFISIHVNSEPKSARPKGTGLIIWVSRNEFNNSELSKLFASALIASFQNNYEIPVPENPMQQQKGIWVLQATKCPAVLIEAGFLSNEKDLTYLKSDEGQTQFAKNVLDAVTNFAANKEMPLRVSNF
ncbi:MAG: N-acetylmuramoyl-L-alanine amidase [Ferruginibacter sp.]